MINNVQKFFNEQWDYNKGIIKFILCVILTYILILCSGSASLTLEEEYLNKYRYCPYCGEYLSYKEGVKNV